MCGLQYQWLTAPETEECLAESHLSVQSLPPKDLLLLKCTPIDLPTPQSLSILPEAPLEGPAKQAL